MGRYCVVKAIGTIREYQSAARVGTLLTNAMADGLTLDQVEEHEVTDAVWEAIEQKRRATLRTETQIAMATQHAKRDVVATRVKQTLNLTDLQFQDLKDALGVN